MVKGNALQLERVKTINIGKSSTLMLLGDVFGVEVTTVDRRLQKTTRIFIPRPRVEELIAYFREVLELTEEQHSAIQMPTMQEELKL